MITTTKTLSKSELARAYVDRIVLVGMARASTTLRLGELANLVAPFGIEMEDLQQLLATNPEKYVYHDRRWLPKARVDTVGQPVNEQIRVTLEKLEGPMRVVDLASELAASRGRPKEVWVERLPKMLNADPYLFCTKNGIAGLRRWIFEACDESPEHALYINELTYEEVEQIDPSIARLSFHDLDSAAKRIIEFMPIAVKPIGFLAWRKLNPAEPYAPRLYDSVALFEALISQNDVVFGADGKLYPASTAANWIRTAIREAHTMEPTVEIEEAAPLEFGKQEIEEMHELIFSSDETFSVSKYLEEKYELTPVDRTYPEDLANAVNALKNAGTAWWVGGDRFRKPNSAPEYIYYVPEFFEFPKYEFRDEDGELIDIELSDDAFSSALRKEMSHPLAMDVLDEDPQPVSKKLPNTIRLVLKSLHRELGTFPLCQFPPGWLETEPTIQEIVFADPQGRELPVWLNHETRLLYNLLDWWFEQPVESGAVFTLTKTQRPNVYAFQWLDETDPLLFIPSDRMEELRDFASRSTDLSTYEIIMEILSKHPKGAHYLTILAETNVVRRVTRRLVASILTGYHCFYQRPGSPVWHFDPKKAAQGFDKAKRKFIRK